MSINRSLYIGLSGMNANTQALNVVGDNIANMNTVGYKSGCSVFQEMLGQSMMGTAGTSMVGSGVSLASIRTSTKAHSLGPAVNGISPSAVTVSSPSPVQWMGRTAPTIHVRVNSTKAQRDTS